MDQSKISPGNRHERQALAAHELRKRNDVVSHINQLAFAIHRQLSQSLMSLLFGHALFLDKDVLRAVDTFVVAQIFLRSR